MSGKKARISEVEFGDVVGSSRVIAKPATSINKDAGTVEAIIATETRDVRRYHWDIGYYYEVLSMDAGHVRMARAEIGLPVHDRHRTYGDQLGITTEVRLAGKQLTGTLKFDVADEAGQRAFGKIERGFVKTVSVGYNVYKMRYLEDAPDGLPIYLATDWEPYEVSLAPMPADIDSQIRMFEEGGKEEKNLLSKIKTRKMEGLENVGREKKENDPANEAQQRELQQAKEAAQEATRKLEVTGLCRKYNMDADFEKKHLDEKTTVDQVRQLILDKVSSAQTQREIKVKNDNGFANPGERAVAMTEGILYRMDGKKFPLTAGREQNPYAHTTLVDMCREYCEREGLSTTGGVRQMVKRAMDYGMMKVRNGGTMTTSDFPLVFANVLKKVLAAEYKYVTGQWKAIAFRQDATRVNTKENTIRLGDFAAMKKVLEGAEYKRQSVIESQEQFEVNKYGAEFGVTLEMIINDDLGAIQRIASKIPLMGMQTEDNVAWTTFKSNPNMGDGNAVFSNAHNNLASAAALAADKLNELYKMVITQKGAKLGDGSDGEIITLMPAYVITGPANQYVLDQILNKEYVATKSSDVTPNYIRNLKPIYTPYITDNSYYVACDPNQIDIMRWGGLVGEPDLSVEEIPQPEVDSWIWHIRKFFGASWVDYRGIAKNPGT